MAGLEFRILGPLEIRRNGEAVAVTAPKQRALLLLLLLRANAPVAQDELIDRLWDGEVPRTARASLQNHIHALRRLLGANVLERNAAGYVLHVEPGQLDLDWFENLVADARLSGPGERAAKLRDALACWRGSPLDEFPLAQAEAARLEERRLTALEDRIDAELELGRNAELVPEIEELVARCPLRERIWAQLMLALYRAGRQAEALATYRRAHHAFAGELGIEPGIALRELQRAILVQDPALDEHERWLDSLQRATAVLPRRRRDRAELLYQYGNALVQLGEWRQAASALKAAEQAATTAGDRGLVEGARLRLAYVSIFLEGADPLEYLTLAERAAHVLEELGDDANLADVLRRLAHVLSAIGRSDQALGVAERALELAVRIRDPWREASSRRIVALCVASGSTPVEIGIPRCEEQLGAAVWDDDEPYGVFRALALLHAQAGRIEEARDFSERDIAAIRKADAIGQLTTGFTSAGSTEHAAGNLGEAERHLRSARAILEVENDHSLLPDVEGELACVLALRGEVAEAGRLALAARARAHANEFAAGVFWRRALALVASQEGRTEEAVRLSGEARTRATASDWLTFRGQTLEEAATIREAGDPAGAQEALRDALATFQRKGNIVGAERVLRRIATYDG